MCRLILCFFTLNLLMFSITAPPVSAQSQLVDRPRRELFQVLKIHELNAETKELAEQLEILPLLEELYDKTKTSTNPRRQELRSKILETILEASFDAASIQAEADREQGRLEALQELYTSRRDRAVELNNATNFIASGVLNTVGSILGFAENFPPFPGNLNQMLSGVVQSGMSTYSLKQQSGSKSRGQGSPTVLAELFGRPIDPDTTYPESVWRFFHGQAPGTEELTRAQVLEKDWILRAHLEPHGSKREKEKIDLVCGIASGGKATMTLDDLADEISMIADVSTVAELMVQELRDLLRMIDSDIDLDKQ
ncbi:MAG: hypothetical protein SGJ27_25635 [Candidatus Melainabacteria bacterium]|nr:hypothetical protein [Candidatus Melainabacteria bacterium]